MNIGAPVNVSVAAAIAKSFASSAGSDCDIVFYLESWDAADKEGPVLGTPLPGHQLVLRFASERFAAQLDRWTQAMPPCSSLGGGASRPAQRAPVSLRPVLRVPLGSDAEVPAARAAISFAYTGQVPPCSGVRELLDIRRQAAYLGIDGCPAECDRLLHDMIAVAVAAAGSTSPVASSRSDPRVAASAVLDLYGCAELFPPDGTEEEASFRGVLAAARPALVAHFRDALSTLQQPALRGQLLELPAAALEALLESDEFGTDCESSVLLLLATWMQRNHHRTGEGERRRLCRLVRLVQLSRPYLAFVLPALAADHEAKPGEPAGWFAIGVTEAAFVSHYASASGGERARLEEDFAQVYEMRSPAYSTRTRRQSLPAAGSSRRFGWHAKKADLEVAMRSALPGQWYYPRVALDGGLRAVAQGLEWRPVLGFKRGDGSTAALYLKFVLPEAFTAVPGSRLSASSASSGGGDANADVDADGASGGSAPSAVMASVSAEVTLLLDRGAAPSGHLREAAITKRYCECTDFLSAGRSRGWIVMLDRHQQHQQHHMRHAHAGTDRALVPVAWKGLLQGGEAVRGALTFLRPTA
ncbi:hypothetical protein GPECTOR_2g1136 [Gonium pectorale]|uniref:BACK domain-containing protein n=1 Tax=Gonium pectorale TaxID=33097 RepID=A0A150H091_GONPE|nr:hypothetical protein GPECTOR_2g1136 [Gonium pectorale]|eukprot:KXZ55586.1 hypothetical protein GPECTOR_2g1136 [Gonium pectorale]